MLAQEIIRTKRDGGVLDASQIGVFVAGLVDGSWSEGQAAALAMAASRTGAIATGVYAGFLVWFVGQWWIEAARIRGFASLASVVAGLLVVAAALWLERICRIKGDGDDDDDGTDEADSAADWVHPRVG